MGNNNEEVVTFKISSEFFGIPIVHVVSIEKVDSYTRMPDLPRYIKGILNLRGDIIPIVDLRQFLLKDQQKEDGHNKIIVVRVDDTLAGLIVDEATEVLDIPGDLIREISFAGREINRYLKVADINSRLVMIVDIVELINNSDIANGLDLVKNIL